MINLSGLITFEVKYAAFLKLHFHKHCRYIWIDKCGHLTVTELWSGSYRIGVDKIVEQLSNLR